MTSSKPGKGKERRFCNQLDRDVKAIRCGYPLPCPYHTLVITPTDGEAGLYIPPLMESKITKSRKTMERVISVAKVFDKKKSKPNIEGGRR